MRVIGQTPRTRRGLRALLLSQQYVEEFVGAVGVAFALLAGLGAEEPRHGQRWRVEGVHGRHVGGVGQAGLRQAGKDVLRCGVARVVAGVDAYGAGCDERGVPSLR